tara:strand:- start:11230 stop:12330 length:1101 start_codon:yes stop_codon:yes gene_type:complete
MSCLNCSNNIVPGCKNKGSCKTGNCGKMPVFDWLSNIDFPENHKPFNVVEVRFKNGRKEYFKNEKKLKIHMGGEVIVQRNQGYDLGVVSLTGELVKLQLKRKKIKTNSKEISIISRNATNKDIDKWKHAKERESYSMKRSRELASQLNLKMKIGDVEFQADNSRAIFYYTSDQRVDFRELIKLIADELKIRVEMKQIGSRQEAQRMGGIGSCGRELCCSTWLNDFRTVSTSAARYQQLSLNPQKLAGQCGKLKCCLNFELDNYVEALKSFPKSKLKLITKKGKAFIQKMDIFNRKIWVSYIRETNLLFEIDIEKVNKIIDLNKKGQIPESLEIFVNKKEEVKNYDYDNVVGQESITRFDKKKIKNN